MHLREALHCSTLEELPHAGFEFEQGNSQEKQREAVRHQEGEAAVSVHENRKSNHIAETDCRAHYTAHRRAYAYVSVGIHKRVSEVRME